MEEYLNRLATYKKPEIKKLDEVSSAGYYYDPYSHIATHEHFINDYETIEKYRKWIENNKHLIKDKIVLDVGCGTGILSMMAAEAGAARVIGIEWSSIVDYTQKIIRDNHLTNKILILKGRVNQVTLPFNMHKVDVIISLWMGFSLLQGDRLKAVIQARDKWLTRFGCIIPDKAILYWSGISDHNFREQSIEWWKNVYGYDMSCVVDDSLKHAHYKIFPSSNVVTNRCKVKEIDLTIHSFKQIMKDTRFRITALRDDHIQGFMSHFTVRFSRDENMTEINTDPLLKPTFWGQTIFYLKDYITVKKKEKLIGSINFFEVPDDARLFGVIVAYVFNGVIAGDVRGMKNFILRV